MCICASVHSHVLASIRVHLCECLCECMHMCMPACLRMCLNCLHGLVCMPECAPACMHMRAWVEQGQEHLGRTHNDHLEAGKASGVDEQIKH